MIQALNDAFDSATTRNYLAIAKVPEVIVYLLFLLAITSAFFAGYSSHKEIINKPVSIIFCLLTVFVIYITIDLDRPRRGFIKLEEQHQVMLDLRTLLQEPH